MKYKVSTPWLNKQRQTDMILNINLLLARGNSEDAYYYLPRAMKMPRCTPS
jgi:hypothetical protein